MHCSSFFRLWFDSADSMVEHDNNGNPKGEGGRRVPLTPFGLASYKMQGDIWVNPDASDQEKLIDLHCAADSWLKQLNVNHHDFSFFTHHSSKSVCMFT